jgi:hypothetical protein
MPVLADDDVIVRGGDGGRTMSMIAFVIWISARGAWDNRMDDCSPARSRLPTIPVRA